MEKAVESRLTDEVLNSFIRKFGLGQEVKKLGDFENFVFEASKDGEPYILRLTHSSHRSIEEIASELDWVKYLSECGLSVSDVFPSIDGLLAESIPVEDGSFFIGCLFSKAQGERVKVQSKAFDVPLFKLWGETVGKMHAATKGYKPSKGVEIRKAWDEDDLLRIEKYFPRDEELVKNAKEIVDALHELPQEKDSYGLIHSDIHLGNFFFDGENINVFDFDDACYHWFASDIAIPLYYSLLSIAPYEKEEERKQFGDNFINAFIKGYESANALPKGWKKEFSLMLKLRDVVLYAVLHKKIAPEDRNERVNLMLGEIEDRLRKKKPIYQL